MHYEKNISNTIKTYIYFLITGKGYNKNKIEIYFWKIRGWLVILEFFKGRKQKSLLLSGRVTGLSGYRVIWFTQYKLTPANPSAYRQRAKARVSLSLWIKV